MEDQIRDIKVEGGLVRGQVRGEVVSYSGIPYAAPPIGKLRWRPPQPVVAWQGVRDASEFGPIAPQIHPIPGVSIPGDPTNQSEDCLSLNVWTPRQNGSKRPVMVWIHGGGFTSGTGAGLLYRGGDLARNGDVVVVTCNYRLGALGFLAHPLLLTQIDHGHAENPSMGNWGLMDQIKVLEWVRDYIEGFDGDPNNVTIFGESAGGMSIAALLSAPKAKGLFNKAIIQSGPIYVHTPSQAEKAAMDLCKIVGLKEFSREKLENVAAEDLVAAANSMQSRLPDPGLIPLPFLPVADDSFVPADPLDAIAKGSAAGITLLIGTNRDELTFFGIGDPRLAEIDDDKVIRWLSHAAPGADGEKVFLTYRQALDARGEGSTSRTVWIAAGSDLVFRYPSLQLAAAQEKNTKSVYVYLFDWESPAFGGLLRSCHALELPFVFGSVSRSFIARFAGGGPEAEVLSKKMQSGWLGFARSSNPTSKEGGEWPTWDDEKRTTMIFGPTSGVSLAPRDEELEVWHQAEIPKRA